MAEYAKGQVETKSGGLSSVLEFFCTVAAIKPEQSEMPGSLPVVKFGASRKLFLTLGSMELRTVVGQFWGIVYPGLILAKHCFRGLQRDMYVDGDTEAGTSVTVYSWKPRYDYVWSRDSQGGLLKHAARKDRVFVVLARPLRVTEGDMYGSILRWNWVAESPSKSFAPFDFEKRYTEILWSR